MFRTESVNRPTIALSKSMIDFLTSLIVLGFAVALFVGVAVLAFRVVAAIFGWFTDSVLPAIFGAVILGFAAIVVTGAASAIFG